MALTSVRGTICPNCRTFARRQVDRTDMLAECRNCGGAFAVEDRDAPAARVGSSSPEPPTGDGASQPWWPEAELSCE